LTTNRIWKERLVDIGVVTYKNALDWGFFGVMLRGSGFSWALRKYYLYDAYSLINFAIPIGTSGDCYDRYLLRVEEMRPSININNQCLNQIPKGPIKTSNKKVVAPSRIDLKQPMESLIHHFKFF